MHCLLFFIIISSVYSWGGVSSILSTDSKLDHITNEIIDLEKRNSIWKNTTHPTPSAKSTIVIEEQQEEELVCPRKLRYPSFSYPSACIPSHLVIWPLMYYGRNAKPPSPAFDDGIVFYVYGTQNKKISRYMDQVLINARAIKSKDPNAHIALITNFNIPLSIAKTIDVIVPVHDRDLVGGVQWYTRVLYNRYLPFNYSYILDTHVFPCYNTSYSQLFKLFKESGVDVSVSNRMNVHSISGGAVLSKRGPGSLTFWNRCVSFMRSFHNYDDQNAIAHALQSRKGYTFRQLSNNWFFASNGILNTGRFKGSSKCYRSSVVVTGPVHWIHGNPRECKIMNGEHDEYSRVHRSYFGCGRCKCAKRTRSPVVALSAHELQSFVHPNKAPKLLWENDTIRDRDALFWDLDL